MPEAKVWSSTSGSGIAVPWTGEVTVRSSLAPSGSSTISRSAVASAWCECSWTAALASASSSASPARLALPRVLA